MPNPLLISKQKKSIVAILLISVALLLSCTDKKEYEMELQFQREISTHLMYENNGILMRIEKEVSDNGNRHSDTTIRDHARNVIIKRNESIDSAELFIVLVDKITQLKNLEDISKSGSFELLTYYQKKFQETHDSLVFQKLINMYLAVEQAMLNEELYNVAGSCNWGRWSEAHVSKTTDTVHTAEIYELSVIPETFDHKFSFVNDDCTLTVYKDGEPVEMKYSILKKGSVYLISLTPYQIGNYEVRGSFSQSARLNKYVMNLKFIDRFVVKK